MNENYLSDRIEKAFIGIKPKRTNIAKVRAIVLGFEKKRIKSTCIVSKGVFYDYRNKSFKILLP